MLIVIARKNSPNLNATDLAHRASI